MRYLETTPRALVLMVALMAASVSAAMAGNGGTPATDAPYSKTFGGGTAGTQPTEFIDVSQKLAGEKPDLAKLMQTFQSPVDKSHDKAPAY